MTAKQRRPRRLFLAVIFIFGSLTFASMHSQISLPPHEYYNQRVTELQAYERESMKSVSSQRASEETMTTEKVSIGSNDLAGLDCKPYGGPENKEATNEMVYWQDFSGDRWHVSPFKEKKEQYLTFEPDQAGWNNIRMSLENVVALAFSMGRTLVLPPAQRLFLLDEKKKTSNGTTQQNKWTVGDFFPLSKLAREHDMQVISMQEFLQRHVVEGKLRQSASARPVFPPGNQTSFDGPGHAKILLWLRDNAPSLEWDRKECVAAFAASNSARDMQILRGLGEQLAQEAPSKLEDYLGKPLPVNTSVRDRLREVRDRRAKLCIYDKDLQDEPVLHIASGQLGPHKPRMRLFIHFYAFLFFQDWRHDLWMKRFIRDHLRYKDEIQCAAARVVAAVRKMAARGIFDTMHVRRGDFPSLYQNTKISAQEILERTKLQFTRNTTVFIATDERDKKYFKPLAEYYHVLFLSDFKHVIGPHVNTNFYGMIDALVAAKGRKFFGCWYSSFTGYINRLRGYHADLRKEPGHEQGVINSWYYVHRDKLNVMRQYTPVRGPFWSREYPAGWRQLNFGIDEFHQQLRTRRSKQSMSDGL